MKQFCKYIGVLISALCIAELVVLGLHNFRQAHNEYNSENVCIAKNIAAGIERSAIVRDRGSCKVRL